MKPAAIRADMARTRRSIERAVRALGDSILTQSSFPQSGELAMAKAKRTGSARKKSGGGKTAMKRRVGSAVSRMTRGKKKKSGGMKQPVKKSARKKTALIGKKAKRVIGTVLSGAAAGAVAGAIRAAVGEMSASGTAGTASRSGDGRTSQEENRADRT